jgi:hypothetical protein
MTIGKINTHLLQDLTVLAKASQKGSIVYISPDKKIHSGTIFQKLQAFIFKNKKDTFLDPIEKSILNQSAKELVTENLKNQIKVYFYIKNKAISPELDSYISEFSERLVGRITDPDSYISNKNEVLDKFKNELNNLNTITTDSTKIESLGKAINHAWCLSESSIKDKSKFKFLALQFNQILNKDGSEEHHTNDLKIDSIAENALWIKKNKWIDSNRALSLAKEMARDELSDLSNNEKFNILQKTLKSFEGKERKYYDENFSSSLANAVQKIQNKKVKEPTIDEKLADFKKTLSYKEKKSINDEIMKEVLIANNDLGLTKDEIFVKYAWTLLEKKYDPIVK